MRVWWWSEGREKRERIKAEGLEGVGDDRAKDGDNTDKDRRVEVRV